MWYKTSCVDMRAVLNVFFFKDPPPTEISPLPLHDALPIYGAAVLAPAPPAPPEVTPGPGVRQGASTDDDEVAGNEVEGNTGRSEEHTSELQSRQYLVCRLLLEKKNKRTVPPRVFTTHPTSE